jgi:hypothetical protein
LKTEIQRWTPFARPLGAENKLWFVEAALVVFACLWFCA